MNESSCEALDPRVRRTRLLLQQALESLLERKEFDKISVQDIAEAATLNRATFYDHYPDKFALLDGLVAVRFHELVNGRGVTFDGTCSSALTGIVLAVCDYLAGTPGIDCARRRQMETHLETAVISAVRRMILGGLKQHAWGCATPSPEMIASTISWAIYGAAKEWVSTPNRCSSEEIAQTMVKLVLPIFPHLD